MIKEKYVRELWRIRREEHRLDASRKKNPFPNVREFQRLVQRLGWLRVADMGAQQIARLYRTKPELFRRRE